MESPEVFQSDSITPLNDKGSKLLKMWEPP